MDHSPLLQSSSDGIEQFPHSDENVFLFTTSTTTNNDSVEKVNDEREQHVDDVDDDDNNSDDDRDEKHHQMDSNPIDDKPSMIDISRRSFAPNETPIQITLTNSHDSLLQNETDLLIPIETTASSTDDLSIMPQQLSSSAFHSKDSALGLSDDNLDQSATFQLISYPPDENHEQISALSLTIRSSQSK